MWLSILDKKTIITFLCDEEDIFLSQKKQNQLQAARSIVWSYQRVSVPVVYTVLIEESRVATNRCCDTELSCLRTSVS